MNDSTVKSGVWRGTGATHKHIVASVVGAMSLVPTGYVLGGPTAVQYLEQVRFVEAGAFVEEPLLSLFLRESDVQEAWSLERFDSTARAMVDLGLQPPDEYDLGGSRGSARAEIRQVSELGEHGIRMRTTGFALSEEGAVSGFTDPDVMIRTVLETTFLLRQAHQFELLPHGPVDVWDDPREAWVQPLGSVEPMIGGSVTIEGLGTPVSVPLADGLFWAGAPVRGTLPPGVYTYRVHLEAAGLAGGVAFDTAPELTFRPIDVGGSDPAVPGDPPAVIPLPGAKTAGLLTLLAAGVVARRRVA